ncbi:TIGR00730 family Rossman fold protein [Marinifilum caeruleilacunae]|uniref:Cytokinin riboside 5'-monophosphate phosphoribohydrolase n=1 Tax=Marinifilum caeruleilacunae TaxID=2499076 RepID=A0ABX1WYE0_9BACT|nr:TIGR00730 family Rossman fold protein [Marinifilum caeruleilacunae]NOU60904.1 TIGR00730 family Rossman fold protein [Marinifilum caeruleilacunae]
MNICVFCSSSNSLDSVYFEEARQLGNLIGSKGFGLVYGGTNVGLMNEVAESVKTSGGKVMGVIPKLINEYGISADFLDELIITPDMAERKKLLRDKSDAFVALPGGFGTLEEILEVITLKQLGYHNKAIVFVNTNNFYENLKAQFELSYKEKFAKAEYRKLFYFANNYQDAIEYIENYKIENRGTKWD